MVSDAFPMYVFPLTEMCIADRGRKEVGKIAYEVDCAMIIQKEGEIDIGASLFRLRLCLLYIAGLKEIERILTLLCRW